MDDRFRTGRTRNLRRRLAVGAAAVVLTCLGVVTTVPGSSPAFADTVVDGCTIVANPTATHFTDCPGVDFSSADLSGVDLSYANLTSAVFARCIGQVQFPYITCPATDLNGADLHDANVSSAVFTAAQLESPTHLCCRHTGPDWGHSHRARRQRCSYARANPDRPRHDRCQLHWC